MPYRSLHERLSSRQAEIEGRLAELGQQLERLDSLRAEQAELLEELADVRARLVGARSPEGRVRAASIWRSGLYFSFAAVACLVLTWSAALFSEDDPPPPALRSDVDCRDDGWSTYRELTPELRLPNGAILSAFDFLNQGLPTGLCPRRSD